MRWSLTAAVFTLLAVAAAGCQDPRRPQKAHSPDEHRYEIARYGLVQSDLAPLLVASIVAASAPPGGPPPLAPLCADAGWRLRYAQVDGFEDLGLKRVPSLLDTSDPDLRIE
jgi:hypothetical protein